MSAISPRRTWTRESRPALRVLIVDDSALARAAIGHTILARSDMELAGKLSNVSTALDFLRENNVDIILLDNEMPGQTGIEALPELIKISHGARIIMLSGNCSEGSEAAVRALALGASDVISKPSAYNYGTSFAEALTGRLWRLALPNHARAARDVSYSLRPIAPGFRMTCLGIGASTGGIHALGEMLGENRPKLGVPILVTQHLPASFIPYFAKQLARVTSLPVEIGTNGMRLLPDHIYIAPGEHNLLCERRAPDVVGITLSDTTDDLQPLPAVDPMLQSMAKCYGDGAVAVILTGMGRDGTIGARHIVESGGMLIAQDEASSVVWGMPGSVARAGLASALMPAHHICGFLKQYTQVPA